MGGGGGGVGRGQPPICKHNDGMMGFKKTHRLWKQALHGLSKASRYFLGVTGGAQPPPPPSANTMIT